MSRVPLPWTLRLAAALFTALREDGFDCLEVVDLAGELLRIAGELAVERRHLGGSER